MSNRERASAATEVALTAGQGRGTFGLRPPWRVLSRAVGDAKPAARIGSVAASEPYAWAAASFFLVGSALLIAALVSLRLDGDGRQVVVAVLAAVCGTAGVVLLLARTAARAWVSLLAVLLGLGVVTVAASSADNLAGLLLSCFGFLWAAVYIGYFFERHLAYGLTAATAACVGVSLGVSGIADPALAGVVVVTTVAAAVLVLRRLVELLEDRANTDPLTGLLNRNGLELATHRTLTDQGHDGRPLSLAVIDLDDFSGVNNRVGHLAADRLLLELAQHWQRALGPDDVVARLGGDEFLLLLPGADAAAACERVEALRSDAPLAWSSGVAEVDGARLEDAVSRADRSLLEAKRRRRQDA